MHTVRSIAGAFALAVTCSSASLAQDAAPAAPCHAKPCVLLFDWGPGKTASAYGADRRYGSGDDFEAKFRAALGLHGYRTADNVQMAVTMTARPRMAKAMCDAMPGTNTDYSCQAMAELAIQFTSADPEVKAPSALRVPNRCGSRDVYLGMAAFAQYAADVVYYNLEGEAKKEPRPRSPGC